jgi:hypothetical protein
MGAVLRAALAAEIPMSQVMPDIGVVSTDGDALLELYHQMARTMLAHRGNPPPIKDVRVTFIAPSGQFQKIDFGSSSPVRLIAEPILRPMLIPFEYKSVDR